MMPGLRADVCVRVAPRLATPQHPGPGYKRWALGKQRPAAPPRPGKPSPQGCTAAHLLAARVVRRLRRAQLLLVLRHSCLRGLHHIVLHLLHRSLQRLQAGRGAVLEGERALGEWSGHGQRPTAAASRTADAAQPGAGTAPSFDRQATLLDGSPAPAKPPACARTSLCACASCRPSRSRWILASAARAARCASLACCFSASASAASSVARLL